MNCAALPSNLIESELFGHEKGAFTGAQSRRLGRFEVADGATLFLDEIGELPLELQPKLLQVIESGEFERLGSSETIKVDVRIIAATNRNLEEEVRKGRSGRISGTGSIFSRSPCRPSETQGRHSAAGSFFRRQNFEKTR